ncbi:alpha/beta hydrolase family protein [Gaopeijia maritima]|uniref:Prolyl oligopeptidase family serine peptidase n=1 Tax=Gaopeijia maritima TaxID=3119007 RepID=A0ABU9E678_9BACT
MRTPPSFHLVRGLRRATGLLLALGLTGAVAAAQDRPRVTEADYDRFESLGSSTMSADGAWLVVDVRRVDDDSELRIHRTDSDSVVVVPHASGPRFSADGRWLGYLIGVSQEEREKAQEANRPVRTKLGLFDLASGTTTERDEVAGFAFSGDGAFLSMRRYGARDADHDGVDVIVRDLQSGAELPFGNISEMSWSDEGALLALVTDAADQVGNGVRLYDAHSGRLRGLDTDEATYLRLGWRDDAADLVVYRTSVEPAFEDTAHVALVWRGLDGDDPESHTLSTGSTAGLSPDIRVVDYRLPSWSDDGSTLFVGLQYRRPAPCPVEEHAMESGNSEAAGEGADESDSEDGENGVRCETPDEDDQPGVEIWHTLDVDPVPQQRVRERQLRQENELAAWHIDDDRLVRLDDEQLESVSVIGGGRAAIGRDETPYDADAMFRQQFFDLYAVDVATGDKEPIAERVTITGGSSPGGRYTLWFAGEDWFAHDLESGTTHNLTEGLGGTFIDLDRTPTQEQMAPFGVAGWMEDDGAVFINDQWDVWMVPMDGGEGRRLTRGAEAEVRYRLTSLDSDDEPGFDDDDVQWFSMYGEWTKQSGYARADRPGAEPETVLFTDARVLGLTKADDADLFVFRQERFDDSPDLFVAGPSLDDARQVTHTNAFLDEFAWGHTELVEYENEWGRRLQGVLTYPADFDPSESYPTIVYQYELLSQGLHQFQVPDPTQYYNQQIWSQNGYFVFRPDIVYRDRQPGVSNVQTLRPAMAAVVASEPAVDPERMGLIGHSWGAYQTTFFVTQDDLFASAVAGAPLTNLMSMYASFYWNSGGTNARIFEISQGRMQVPWWEDFASYEANSPVHHIENMNTPLLMAFGTNDGAVEYNQGVEFYNAARRLGKQMVMLSYQGENHGFSREPNQLDYQSRIMQWFGHYLKGEPAPDWITRGLSYIDQKDRVTKPKVIS